MEKIELSIVIVNYNTAELLKNCLQAVYHALQFGKILNTSEVIVVDNASKDESFTMVSKYFTQVNLILNKKNLGFTRANNQAIKKAQGKYILLLNSDTQINKSALIELLKEAKQNKEIGVVGGKLLNKDGSLQQSLGFFPHILKIFCWMVFLDDFPSLSILIKPYHAANNFFYKRVRQVDWISGACMLVKREAIETVGLLDEAIFMYGEEVEWCYRIKKAGFLVTYTPYAEILHLKGESSGEKVNAGITAEFKSIFYFYKKHKPIWQQYLLKLVLKFGALLRILLFGIIVRNSKKADLYAKAFQMVE